MTYNYIKKKGVFQLDKIKPNINKNSEKRNPIEDRIDTVMTDGVKVMIVMCASAFRFGGNWAFLKKDDSEYEGKKELLLEEKSSIIGRPVSNGVVILMDKNYLTKNVNAVIPNGIDKKFIAKANTIRAEEIQKYDRFIKSVLDGKSKYLVNGHSYKELTMGTYCINDTNIIRLNGVDYPSYKLELDLMLRKLIEVNKKYRRQILIKVINRGMEGFMPLETAINKMEAIHSGLEISDTNTGVFVTLRFK